MADNKDDFFVGYFPMSKRLKRFTAIAALGLILVGAGFAYWVASSQRSAGHGHWDLDEMLTLQGYISVDPYPVLHTTGADSRSIMLLAEGKHSALKLVDAMVGEHVQVSGYRIGRGNWMSLELTGANSVAAVEAPAGGNAPQPEVLDVVTLRGEVVDSKCFLGVMKPGLGKVHRACAALCVEGGIPPMLVVRQNDGGLYGYVLVDADGRSAADEVADAIAVPVEISGQLVRRGDLTYLRIAVDGVEKI